MKIIVRKSVQKSINLTDCFSRKSKRKKWQQTNTFFLSYRPAVCSFFLMFIQCPTWSEVFVSSVIKEKMRSCFREVNITGKTSISNNNFSVWLFKILIAIDEFAAVEWYGMITGFDFSQKLTKKDDNLVRFVLDVLRLFFFVGWRKQTTLILLKKKKEKKTSILIFTSKKKQFVHSTPFSIYSVFSEKKEAIFIQVGFVLIESFTSLYINRTRNDCWNMKKMLFK